MKVSKFVIANFNWGRLKNLPDHPSNKVFIENLDIVNHLADKTPGFLWRFITEGGTSISYAFRDDPLNVINLSKWETIEDLYNFSYRGKHLEVFKQRSEWFEVDEYPNLVLWWIDKDHNPTVKEAEERLSYLSENGPSNYAFTFREQFDPPIK